MENIGLTPLSATFYFSLMDPPLLEASADGFFFYGSCEVLRKRQWQIQGFYLPSTRCNSWSLIKSNLISCLLCLEVFLIAHASIHFRKYTFWHIKASSEKQCEKTLFGFRKIKAPKAWKAITDDVPFVRWDVLWWILMTSISTAFVVNTCQLLAVIAIRVLDWWHGILQGHFSCDETLSHTCGRETHSTVPKLHNVSLL